jgi:hypothetical protein
LEELPISEQEMQAPVAFSI